MNDTEGQEKPLSLGTRCFLCYMDYKVNRVEKYNDLLMSYEDYLQDWFDDFCND